jgi:hypothetical protein
MEGAERSVKERFVSDTFLAALGSLAAVVGLIIQFSKKRTRMVHGMTALRMFDPVSIIS